MLAKDEIRRRKAERKRRWRKKNPEKWKAANRRWNEKNKERHRAWMKEYQRKWRRKKANRARLRRYAKTWQAKHPDRYKAGNDAHNRRKQKRETPEQAVARKAKCRKRYRKHRKEQKRAARLYYRNHKEEVREYRRRYRLTPAGRLASQLSAAKRRAHKAGAKATLTRIQWLEIVEQQKSCCYYCGKFLSGKGAMSQDHKTPFSRGGHHTRRNVVLACLSCNSQKGEKTEAEYRKFLAQEFIL